MAAVAARAGAVTGGPAGVVLARSATASRLVLFFPCPSYLEFVIWLKMEVAASIQVLPLALGFFLHEFRYCWVVRLLGLHAAIRKCFAPCPDDLFFLSNWIADEKANFKNGLEA